MMKRRKIENYIAIILFAGLILFIVLKFDLSGFLAERKESTDLERNVETWMENAKGNLKEDFIFLEGRNHFFVKGRLVSECTELDPSSHCPISISGAKINNDSLLFVGDSRFAIPILDIYPYSINEEGINFVGFLNSGQSSSILEFTILDYIPNATLCKGSRGRYDLCTIKWIKKIFLDEPILAENLLVEIEDFDYSFLDQALKISLKGEIEIPETKKRPEISLALYSIGELKKFLINESNSELQDKDGIYVFEFNSSFNLTIPEETYSVLFLVAGENSFYAKEWILENREIVDTVIYD